MFTTRQILQRSALLAIGVLALTGSPALAQNYVFSDLGTINGPLAGTNSGPSNINNQGQVVIGADINYLYSAGTYTQYQNLPGGEAALVGNVNDLGHTAGWIYLGAAADANIPVRYDGPFRRHYKYSVAAPRCMARPLSASITMTSSSATDGRTTTLTFVRCDGTVRLLLTSAHSAEYPVLPTASMIAARLSGQ